MGLNRFIITESISIYEAASIINQNGYQIAFVCRDGQLVAAISDGDIRRHILRNGDFSQPVSEIANYDPKYIFVDQRQNAASFLRKYQIHALPVLNHNREILSIEFGNQLRVERNTKLDASLVIMAGGKGTRLAPYTDVLPKPLIPVGEKTITEHILTRFLSYSCTPVYMIVNYKKSLIKAFFQDSDYADIIQFIEEDDYLGTGGGLRLLEGIIEKTFFLSNCDILVDADYSDILQFHTNNNYLITMVCAMKKVCVPYGTVQLNKNGTPAALIEKPEYSLLTNTGLYVIDPAFLQRIPKDTAIHITDAIQALIEEDHNYVGIYPISDDAWMDMGEMNEMKAMRARLENTDA